jgi:site-specific DNA recombinase
VAAILANPRYTGRQVWNRQRTDFDLVDPANTGLGHRPVQRWNLPAGWVISARPAHPPIVSEADYIAAQDASAPRGPTGPATRRYLLAGLLCCGLCGRRMESAWSNGKPAYRCRHGYASAPVPTPDGRRTCMSAKTTSCPAWPPWPSCRPVTATAGPAPSKAAPGSQPRPGRGPHRPPQSRRRHTHLRPRHEDSPDRQRRRRHRQRRITPQRDEHRERRTTQ